MLSRVMMLRGCSPGAALLRQRQLVTSAAQTRTCALAAPGAAGLCRARPRRQIRLQRDQPSSRSFFAASEVSSAFGRKGAAASASAASGASTSGGDDDGELAAAAGTGRGPAGGAEASPSASSEETELDEEEEEEDSADEVERRPRVDPKAPVKRILKVPTPTGMKELLMQGNMIVETSLAEMIEPADNQRITQSEYMQSCVTLATCPPPKYPEFAMIGRSNVGKSSLINLITTRKQLAMVSKTPGKTQTINHFKVVSGSSGPWYLVDLPGYGFAKAPGDITKKWAKFTQEYFLKRESLVSVMLLVDGSISPQAADLEVADWLGENGVPFSIIFTKVDKKRKVRPGKRSNALENVEEFLFELGQTWTEFPPMVLTSSSSAAGKQELGNHIAFLRNRWKKGGMRRSVKPPTGKAGAAKGGAATGAEKSPAGDDEDDF